MNIRHLTVSLICFTVPSAYCMAQRPTQLTTDLLEHTDVVWQDGYVSSMSLADLSTAIERCQTAQIYSRRPMLNWVVGNDRNDTRQTAYRILVASAPGKLAEGKADVWDSGKVESDNSVAVEYGGPELKSSTVYYWQVKTWDNHGTESPYSAMRGFVTADSLDGRPAHYPLQTTDDRPVTVNRVGDGDTFIAFGKATFGRLFLTLTSDTGTDTVTVRFGEKSTAGRVDRMADNKTSSVRYAEYRLPLRAGRHTYIVKFRPDRRNTDRRRANESKVLPVYMPEYTGEVFPFRFCEVAGYAHAIVPEDVRRQSVNYPYNDLASYFHSSDSVLNRVWDLCKHSVKATSFTGVYVDGDRERIAYEADAIIGQLGHYATDREYSMARYSHEYLLYNPTWPTEWNLQSLLIAWYDYMYTGDSRSLARCYDVLKAKTLLALKEDNGLISTRTGKVTKEVCASLNFKGPKMKDIVDWPQSGYVGTEKERAGEADGFVMTDYNTVVNAFHYNAVRLMSMIAGVLGRQSDREYYQDEAARIRQRFNRLLLDRQTGLYRDGVETDHSSLHANMFPMAFGLVPDERKKGVAEYVKSRRMACSVYGAQFLMDALYEAGEGDYALSLLASTGERSWYNMLRSGSTITMEAWDDKYKPNQDWNHIWGAVPANIILRGLFGIQPIEPGFKTFRIKPQPGTLSEASIKVPSVRGDIKVSFNNMAGKRFVMDVEIPANSMSEVWMPCVSKRCSLLIDGKTMKGKRHGQFVVVMLGSGKHQLTTTVL